jgi:iron complex outermembrane receptor protein
VVIELRSKLRPLAWSFLLGAPMGCISVPTGAQVGVDQDKPSVTSPQPAAEVDDSQAGDIIVTAQKRAQTLSDVPVSVTALTGSQLIQRGVNDVRDLVKVTPGLSFVDSGKAAPVLSLRGVGFFENAFGARPTVSVYIDEAPLPFSIQARAASFDLERVEVLKGPQGTLFGQSATGGAINYIAARPTSELSGGVTASYGRFDMTDVHAFVSGPLGPTLNARLAVHSQRSGDWQKSYTRDGGDDTMGRQDFTQARLLLDWKPSDNLTIRLNANGFIDRSDNQAPQLVGAFKSRPSTPLLLTYPAAPARPRAADWRPGQDFDRSDEFYQGVLRADLKVSDALTLTSLTSYSHEDVDNYISDGTTLLNLEVRDFGYIDSFSQELRASGDVGALHYLVGGNYQRDKTDETQETLAAYATSTAIAGDDVAVLARQKFSTVALFGDVTYSFLERLRLTVGSRYTRQDLDYGGCLAVFNQNSAHVYTRTINTIRQTAGLAPIAPLAVGACASLDPSRSPARATGNLTEDNVSWRAILDFKPTPRTLLYVNVSKGFKGGSIPAPGASSTEQFRPVTQESVIAYEAGIKTSLFDRKLEFTGAAFYYDYSDKQLLGRNVFNPDIFGAQSSLVNIPKSRVVGAETQFVLRPVKGLTLTAAGTYLDTKVRSNFLNYSLLGTPTNFKDSSFPYTPKWQLVFDGEKRTPVTTELDGIVGFNASYRTRTTAGFGGDPRLDIAPYWLVDVRLGIEDRTGRWTAGLYGRNVLNEYYWTNVSAGGDLLRRYAGMPATYGVQLGARF